ncbi:MAG: signal peptidase II, partial [Cyanobacteria bacterium J06576_12]
MKPKNAPFWIVAIAGIILDYFTKQAVIQWIVSTSGEAAIETMKAALAAETGARIIPMTTVIDGVLNFDFILNDGAAFGLFSKQAMGAWLLPLLSLVVSLGLMFYGWVWRIANRWEAIGYGFILGGAFGNGIERLFGINLLERLLGMEPNLSLRGYVVDFISVFPTTNLPVLNHPFPIFNVADIWINLGILCLLAVALTEPENGARGDTRGDKRPRPRKTHYFIFRG